MNPRHYQVIRRGDITVIRTARGEAPIRRTDLGRLIAELQVIDAELNPRPAFERDHHLDDPELSGSSRRLGSSSDVEG